MLATELQVLKQSNSQIGDAASCKLQALIEGGNFGAKLTHRCGF